MARWVHRFEAPWKAAVSPRARGPWVLAWALLVPLSWLYRVLSALKRAWFAWVPGARVRVAARVVSVGNLAVGGTGKTPLTALVARSLARAGRTPAILVRGYGAAPSAPVLVAGRGGRLLVPVREVGDEGSLLAAAVPEATLIVSRRRADGARRAVAEGADAIVLDDGLQYWRLARDFDVVALDGEEPFGNGWIFPAGVLREGPGALARAGAIVVKEGAGGARGVPPELAREAPGVPVYRARYRPLAWVRRDGSVEPDLARGAAGLAAMVAGIARPEPFFALVEGLAGRALPRAVFPDHHLYSREELAGLGAVLAMTEKDGANLPAGPLEPEVRMLRVELVVEPVGDAPPFETLIQRVAAG